MSVLGPFAMVVLLAVLVEGIVEHFAFAVPPAYKPYVALVLGVGACIGFQVDMFQIMKALHLIDYSPLVAWVGMVATGLIVGRGSNYVNDLVSRLGVVSLPAAATGLVLADQADHLAVTPPGHIAMPGPEPGEVIKVPVPARRSGKAKIHPAAPVEDASDLPPSSGVPPTPLG